MIKDQKVLDHGLVKFVGVMGDDQSVVQAARVSYGMGTKTKEEDRGLIRYLMRHRHTTPFEMCEIKLLCKMPIFVARQWVRHRTASINEYSARYSIVKDDFYVPAAEHINLQSANNKQGRGAVFSDPEAVRTAITDTSLKQYQVYEALLQSGVAREIARTVLPINFYTEWYWKIDLHNLLHFLKLRLDPHAQYEIRVYAEAIAKMVQQWVPITWEAFEDYVLHAQTFSRQEIKALGKFFSVGGFNGTLEGLTTREIADLQLKIAHITGADR